MMAHSWALLAVLLVAPATISGLPNNEKRSMERSSGTSKRIALSPAAYSKYGETDPEFWYSMAATDIRERMNVNRPLHKRAKNVVFFLGDGMGISTITAARIFKGQLAGQRGEEGQLEFDRFPYSALIKTYNLDKQVADSAGTATAYLTGVKANFKTLGVSGKVNQHTLDCDLINASSVSSILQWALDAGKVAGVVTTTRITHATPAASYAHVPERKWEGTVPSEVRGKPGCKDIARQLVEDYPGNRLSVILGGGRRAFLPKGEEDPKGIKKRGKFVSAEGDRVDGRNLIDEWTKKKAGLGLEKGEYSFVNSSAGLRSVDLEKTKYLLGLFSHNHMEYDQLRDKGDDGEPSLMEMTETAIRLLTRLGGDRGFVLLVEGGRIDHAHHQGYTNLALYETVEFDRAIARTREMLPKEETLLLVTADHSHGLTINGYQARGSSISGMAGKDVDEIPFTTLMYSNGPGFMTPDERENKIEAEDTKYLKYRVHAGVHTEKTNHAGEDVAVFSTGPMAHFFGGTHEQSYIAHVVGFAACIGVYTNQSHCQAPTVRYRAGREREWTDNGVTFEESPSRRGVAVPSSRSMRMSIPNFIDRIIK